MWNQRVAKIVRMAINLHFFPAYRVALVKWYSFSEISSNTLRLHSYIKCTKKDHISRAKPNRYVKPQSTYFKITAKLRKPFFYFFSEQNLREITYLTYFSAFHIFTTLIYLGHWRISMDAKMPCETSSNIYPRHLDVAKEISFFLAFLSEFPPIWIWQFSAGKNINIARDPHFSSNHHQSVIFSLQSTAASLVSI